MSRAPEQIPFELLPCRPYSLDYFVSHSGVTVAMTAIEQAIDAVEKNSQHFELLYLYGGAGSGKTHLISAYLEIVQSKRIAVERIDLEQVVAKDEGISQFISLYEKQKSEGGLLFIESRLAPADVTANPHLSSRLLAGTILQLDYPREEELRPIVRSLLERNNLRIAERSIEYLFRRMPREPLFFSELFAKISRLSLRTNRPAKFTLIKDVLGGA